MRVPRLFRAAHGTTVCFFVAALLFSIVPANAAPPVFNGSVAIPSGGIFSNVNWGLNLPLCSNGSNQSTTASCTYTSRGAYNVREAGAKCDGTSDDSAVFNGLSSFPAFIPNNLCYLNESFWSLPSKWSGRVSGGGQIETVESSVTTLQAPDLSLIKTAPTMGSNYNESGLNTAFAGDFSKTHLAWASFISGTTTLGQPSSGYQYTPAASGIYAFFTNNSGWNQDTADNGGRTGATAYRTVVQNGGQGDTTAYNCSGFVNGANKAGATSFLANPAIGCFGGDVSAGTSGEYLNPYETICSDAGFDVTCNGIVLNFKRTNNTGALGTEWEGVVVQSPTGTKPIDAAFAAGGYTSIGVDLTGISSYTPTAAAMAFAAGMCIYPNATNSDPTHYSRYTSLGTTKLCYNSTNSDYEVTVGGTLAGKFTTGSFVEPNGSVSGSAHNACSATSGWPCEASGSCSISAATFCTYTVTVPAGSVCTATGNNNDTTTGAEWWKASISSTTLTVYALVAASQTNTGSSNVTCL